MADKNNIKVLEEASNLLRMQSSQAQQSQVVSHGAVMLRESSSSGLFTRLNRTETLRATGATYTTTNNNNTTNLTSSNNIRRA